MNRTVSEKTFGNGTKIYGRVLKVGNMLIKLKFEKAEKRSERARIKTLIKCAVFCEKIRFVNDTVFISTNYNPDLEALKNLLQINGYKIEFMEKKKDAK